MSAGVSAIVVLFAVAVASLFILQALGVDSLTVGTEGTITSLFSFTYTQTEISMGIGPGVLVVGALLGLIYALVRSYVRVARA